MTAPEWCAVDAGDVTSIDRAVAAAIKDLDAGRAIVVPTDTVYGLAARADDPAAVQQLFDLKQRHDRQPLAVLVGGIEQVEFLAELDGRQRRVMARLWPGALTLVVTRRSSSRALDLGGDPATIGVRCPASPVMRAIAAAVGPVATTSANRHGQPTPHEAADAAAGLAGQVALVVDGGPCRDRPSTVIDTTVEPWSVLRAGPVSLDAVLAAGAAGPPSPADRGDGALRPGGRSRRTRR
ncbi:MAG TPA: L-threonylcarbamoyladenylate synthase [Acidimicrobiales bacterium]|nr:L-threonylcarbamoyladenylate synthase [Acidimicrobiales bacterium]